MKKALSLALALVICLSLTVSVFAAAPATLTNGDVSLTLSSVLFEEDVPIHFAEGYFADENEVSDMTLHIYHVPALEDYSVVIANHGAEAQGSGGSVNMWPLSLENGVWTAGTGGGIGDGDPDTTWPTGASWNVVGGSNGFIKTYRPGYLYSTSASIGGRSFNFWCVVTDQPLAGNAPAAPAKSETATPTNDKLTVNGALQSPTVYKINGNNYFKIRDLAAMLNGTEKQFDVGYDGALKSVTATTGKSYAKRKGDLTGAAAGGSQTANPSNDTIYIDGQKIDAAVYKIGGNNYFKLRDLGKALNFYVGWTQADGVFIDTSRPYSK